MNDKELAAVKQARYALTMLVNIEKADPWQVEMFDKTVTDLRSIIRQATPPTVPMQEPLALTDEQLQMLNFLYGAGEWDGVWFDEKHPTKKGAFWWRSDLRRLFTTPPIVATPLAAQKPWVGLTDEEAKRVFNDEHCNISADLAGMLARAIEAKLKAKNERKEMNT